MAEGLVFLLEMPPEHLSRLIDCMVNLQCYASTCSRLFDDLFKTIIFSARLTHNKDRTHIHRFVVDLQRSAVRTDEYMNRVTSMKPLTSFLDV
jgi:hypothetical protein